MEPYSVVELAVDLPEHGLTAGMTGTIVEVYQDPPGYEIEFVDVNGRTLALLAVQPDQVRPAH